MRRTLFAAAAALALLATDASAQAKPNFAGKWTLVPDPNAAGGGGGGGGGGGRGGRGLLGAEGTVAQDDKTLTITRTTQAGEIKSVYNLDGSDSKNTMNMGGNAVESVSKAKWDGDKLLITTTTSFNGNSIESTYVLQLTAPDALSLQTTGVGRGGGAPTTTTANYKKG